MNKKLQYLFFTVLAILLMTNKEQFCEHFSFGQAKLHHSEPSKSIVTKEQSEDHDPVVVVMSDSVFFWDERFYDFIPVRAYDPTKDENKFYSKFTSLGKEEDPLKVTWKTLTRIEYTIKYFEEIGTEMYAPIFPDGLKKLDGKLVEIEGYIIPFETTGEEIALSANPYASCFFCGKASPASVMSLKLAKKGKRYKMDARKKFMGRLRLNYDDPGEFYYILQDALPID